MATNSREARRRKILERGSDRLALITGRIQTLPSSSSSPDPQTQLEDTTTPSSPPPASDVQAQIAELPSEIEQNENESDSTLARTQSETTSDALRAIDSQVQQLLSSLTAQNAPPQQPPARLYQPQRRPLFTASGVSNAIAESERIRLSFSAVIAMLVVLVHLGFPFLGSSSVLKTLLGFRPLYVVLLTNVTFVLAKILGQKRVSEWPGETGSSGGGVEWFSLLGKALEIGLVGQKVLDALFMDCAVYAIIVVCGLSSSA